MTTKTIKKPTLAKPGLNQAKICDHCHQNFQTTVYWQRFCSLRCRQAYQYEVTKLGRQLAKEQLAREHEDQADQP